MTHFTVRFSVILVAVLLSCRAAPLAAQDVEKEKPNEAWWELEDDSIFDVTVEPWPLKQGGTVTIKANASTDDSDQKFKGTVHYRIATAEENKAPWVAMKQVKAKEKGDVAFEATAKLPAAAKVWVQFMVKQASEEEPAELTDWTLELQK